MPRMSLTKQMEALGFDLCSTTPFQRGIHVRCSQCAALVINGVPTHERGCPNVPLQLEKEGYGYDAISG
jgi:hypothetical protein